MHVLKFPTKHLILIFLYNFLDINFLDIFLDHSQGSAYFSMAIYWPLIVMMLLIGKSSCIVECKPQFVLCLKNL